MGFWSGLFGSRAQPQQVRAPTKRVSAGLISHNRIPGNYNPLAAMAQVPSLYRVVDKVATSVARAGWVAVRVQGKDDGRPVSAQGRSWARRLASLDGGLDRQLLFNRAVADGELVELPEHPMLDLLQRGSMEFDATTNLYLIEMYLLLVGEVYVCMNRGTRTGKPTSLQPFPPTMLDSKKSPTHIYFKAGKREWSYRKEDVRVFRRPHPVDPYNASLGMAQTLLNDLDIDESATVAVASRFRNGMTPDLLIQIAGVEDEGIDTFEAKLEDRHRGPGKVGKPIATNADGIDVQPLSPTLVDMDVVRLRGQQADVIREVLGVPPEIFGKVENSNRATAEAAQHLYGAHVIDPQLNFLMRSFNYALEGMFEDGVFLMYESPIPANKEFQLAVTEVHPGSFKENEKRTLAGMPLQTDGDQIRGTSYTSGQIQQVIFTSTQVAMGQMDRDAGIRTLTVLYNIKPEDAEAMVGPEGFEARQPASPPGAQINDPKEDDDEDEGEGDEEQAPSGNS